MRWIRNCGTLLSCALLVPFLAACPNRDADRGATGALAAGAETGPGADAGQPPADLIDTAESARMAWNGTDAAAVARFYTEDATVTTNDSTYRGRADIEQRWVAPGVQGVHDLQGRNERMEAHGGDFVQSGDYHFTGALPDGQPVEGSGTFRTTWTRTQAGEWRIREQEVRSNDPPPSP